MRVALYARYSSDQQRAASIADAITVGDDGHATSIMPARSDFGVLRIAPCLFLLVARPEEIDADLVAIDPG